MHDHLVRGTLEPIGLRVLYVRVTETARIARMLHGCYPTAALFFAQGLAAGALLGALQKEKARINLQVTCDGPVGGLLVDADDEGNLRGYVYQPRVNFPGEEPGRAVRAALGQSGRLSVLRDLGEGNLYRGSVELKALDLSRDLRRYFDESEQTDTALDIRVISNGEEQLGEAAAILVQKLPDGDSKALATIDALLAQGSFAEAMQKQTGAQARIAAALQSENHSGEPFRFELVADQEISYRCRCSYERAAAAVSALGVEGLLDVLAKEKEAVITCEFCQARYVVDEPALEEMVRRLRERDAQEG